MAFMSVPTKAILMYRAPIEGQVKKRLAQCIGDAEALSLYRWMGRRQLAAIPSAWPVEVRFTPDESEASMRVWLGRGPRYAAQGAGDLGDRMWRAAEAPFDRGDAQKLIFMGADCPGLDETLLLKASNSLDVNDFVIGPAADGGYYLLGMRGCRSLVFENINWGSATVFAETIERIERLEASYELLETLRDIDDEESLKGEKGRLDAGIREELRLD